jgi:hypothetical protein
MREKPRDETRRDAMDRRDTLAALVGAPVAMGLPLEAQEPASMDPSLYTPKAHAARR